MDVTPRQRLYRVTDVAAELRVSAETIRRWIRRGAVRVTSVGPSRSIRITEGELRNLLSTDTHARETRREEQR